LDLLENLGRNQHWSQMRYWADKKPFNWTLGEPQYQDAAIEASAGGKMIVQAIEQDGLRGDRERMALEMCC
jgi:hypothetical protein